MHCLLFCIFPADMKKACLKLYFSYKRSRDCSEVLLLLPSVELFLQFHVDLKIAILILASLKFFPHNFFIKEILKRIFFPIPDKSRTGLHVHI